MNSEIDPEIGVKAAAIPEALTETTYIDHSQLSA